MVGNTVLDSITVQIGQRGKVGVYISLVLLIVLRVSVVTENNKLKGKITRKGIYRINKREILRAFKVVISISIGSSISFKGVQIDTAIILGLNLIRLVRIQATAEAKDIAIETSQISNNIRFSYLRQISNAILGKDESNSGVKKSGNGSRFIEQVINAYASSSFKAVLVITAGCIITKYSSVLILLADGFKLDGRSVVSYGLDSIVGAKLRNWLFKELGLNITFRICQRRRFLSGVCRSLCWMALVFPSNMAQISFLISKQYLFSYFRKLLGYGVGYLLFSLLKFCLFSFFVISY